MVLQNGGIAQRNYHDGNKHSNTQRTANNSFMGQPGVIMQTGAQALENAKNSFTSN